MTPFLYQEQPIKVLAEAVHNNRAAIDGSDCGCFEKDTPILMHDGSIKPVQDVVVGDIVMGWEGNPAPVTELHRGREFMVRVKPIKGDPFVVNESHILTLVQIPVHASHQKRFATNNQVLDVTVKEFSSWKPSVRALYKLFRVRIDCWSEADQPIPPYLLGVLLGDGSLIRGRLSLSKPGRSIELSAKEIGQIFDAGVRYSERSLGNPSWCFNDSAKLADALDSVGLLGLRGGDKFVPRTYKIASLSQRQAILAGLLDTDGYRICRHGGYEYVSASHQLATDVVFLARSVGLAAYLSQTQKYCQTGGGGTYWRVSISGDSSALPCKIKPSLPRRQTKSVLRTGFTLEPLPENDFYGFSLLGDGRFCLGDFTVTHNTGKTVTSLFAIKQSKLPAAVVCSKSAIPAWRDTAAEIGVSTIFVANVERLKADQRWIVGDKLKWKWQVPRCVVVIDEVHRFSNSPKSENAAILANAPKPLLMLSATAAPDPTKMRALVHQLGIARWDEWYSWCGRNGCKKGYWGGIEFKGDREILDRVHRQIFDGKRGVRVRIEDLPDYPENYLETISVPVEDQQAIDKAYQVELETLEANAPNPGVVMMRARQISEHQKIASLIDMTNELTESGRSVAIFVNFRDTLERLVARFKCPFIHGDTSSEERGQAMTLFNTNQANVFVLMIAAGGESISLPDLDGKHPRTALILPGLSARELIQATYRIHRATSKSPAQTKFVFADGTLESRIRRNLDKKIIGHAIINDGLTDDELTMKRL